MIRIPLTTLFFSVVFTAAGAFAFWQSRQTELESRPRIREEAAHATFSGSVTPAAAPDVSFKEFCIRWAEAKHTVSFLDRLSAPELEALLDSAGREQWERKSGGNADLLLARWMELDPDAAVAWCLAQPPEEIRKAAGFAVLHPWAEADPAAAVRWFTARTGHRLSDILTTKDKALQNEWGDVATILKDYYTRPLHDIVKDLRTLTKEDLEPHSYVTPTSRLTDEFDAAVSRRNQFRPALELLQSIAADPSHPLAGWAENRKPFLLRDGVSQNPIMVMQWLEAHPHSAWGDGLVEEALPGLWSAARENALTEEPGSEPVARPSKDEVVEWFLRIPRVNKEQSALEYFVQSWPDLDEAGTLLNRQAPGSDTDKARAVMALRAVDVDPFSAFPWASAITDESLRRKTETEIQEKWRRLDPAGAASWSSDHHDEQ